MKITVESTVSEIKYSRSVQITTDRDDLNIYEVWEDMIVPALLAYGFGQGSIDQINK